MVVLDCLVISTYRYMNAVVIVRNGPHCHYAYASILGQHSGIASGYETRDRANEGATLHGKERISTSTRDGKSFYLIKAFTFAYEPLS